ncbi:MAG: hypothetical protein Kow0059_11600 [Candidatus Sumerlaeia bacterium]
MIGLEPGIVVVAVGAGLLVWLKAPLERFHGTALPALAFCMGIYTVTAVTMIPALITGRFYLPAVWGLGAVAFGAAIASRRWIRGLLARRCGTCPQPPAGPAQHVFVTVLAAASIYNAVLVAGLSQKTPIIGFDAVGNYAMKARIWFETRRLSAPPLTDPEFITYHRRYPPAIPAMEMTWAYLLGGWDNVKIKWFFLLSWAGIGAMLWTMLRRRNGPAVAWMGTAVWMAVPYHLRELHGGATDAYPETPFTLGLLAAFMIVRELADSRRRGDMILMALAAAGPILIKQEGLFFTALIVLYLAVRRAPAEGIALTVLAAAIWTALWKLAGRGLPAHLDESYLTFNVGPAQVWERLRTLASFLPKTLLDRERWGWMPALVAGAWLYKFWRLPWRRWGSLELAAGGLLFLIYLVVLLNTPLDFTVHLDTTLHRLVTHVLPFVIVASFDNLEAGGPCFQTAAAAAPLDGGCCEGMKTNHG